MVLCLGHIQDLAEAERVKDEKEALRMATSFENETLLFFYRLRDSVYGADKPFIDKIVAKEKSHIQRLVGMR